MPASSSFLRLLALGASADIAEAFGTLRKGMNVVEEIGTESVGGGGPRTCWCADKWYCNIDGPNSLENPPGGQGSFTNAAFAKNFVNECWNMCYKNPAYMRDGSAAVMWTTIPGPLWQTGEPLCGFIGEPAAGDPAEIWRTGMCRLDENGAGRYTKKIMGRKIPSNPFKDSCMEGYRGTGGAGSVPKGTCQFPGNNGTDEYTTFVCNNIGGQNTPDALADTRTAEERCALVVQENSAEIKEMGFNPAMIKMRSDPRFVGKDDQYICEHLYKYWELDGNRMYNRGEYDRATGKCKMYVMDGSDTDNPTNTRAQECKKMLCGSKQLDQCRSDGLNGAGSFECFYKSDGGVDKSSHQGAKSYDPVTGTYSTNLDPATGKCRPDCGNPDGDCQKILGGTFVDPCPGACA